MIQTKALAPRLLRLRAAHSGSPPALKTMVKLKSRRPMALLARAVEVTHQLRQLGDIGSDPSRLVLREQGRRSPARLLRPQYSPRVTAVCLRFLIQRGEPQSSLVSRF